jgi:hypothetical protein
MLLVPDSDTVEPPRRAGAGLGKKILRVILIAAIVVAADVGGVYWYHARHNPTPIPPPIVTAPITKPSAPVAVVPVAPPDPWHGLMAGPVTLEKTPGSHLVHAIGILRNTSDHERFGVTVQLNVYNEDNEKIGTATDYTSSIVAGKEWRFKALVTDRAAKSAQLTAVKEN